MAKPKIAVVNSSSTLSSCYIHLDALSHVVQQAIREAGGLPFEIRTAAPSDFVTSAGQQGRYLMPTRDLIVNDIEVMVEGAELDGMVCLSSCDKTTPAHLMAAVRLNIPSVLVIGGYQSGGSCGGRAVNIHDVYEGVGALKVGATSLPELTAMTEVAVDGPGVCAGLGTANTMHVLAEALGMTMPGSAPVKACSRRMLENARAASRRIVAMVAEDLRPRSIVTEAALRNAVRTALALGGSVNCVRHLSAIATEGEIAVDVVAAFEALAPTTPLLCTVQPNGTHSTEDLEVAGGARQLMYEIRGLLDGSALTVNGTTISDELASAPVPERRTDVTGTPIIRDADAPVSSLGGLDVLRGSLAPNGALVKRAALGDGRLRFEGPARIYDCEDDAINALEQGRINSGDVLVLRGIGPRGGPGTMFAAGFVAALAGAGLVDDVAVVTDGELSGLNGGVTVGQVMPEAAANGPLSLVRDGDHIIIDLVARKLDMNVPQDRLAARAPSINGHTEPATHGWLSIYRTLVGPIEQGAVMTPRDKEVDY